MGEVRRGGLGGWLLIFGGLGLGLVLWLAPVAGASSRDGEARAKRDFDSLVHRVEGRYQIHGKTVPMMWLANICARRFTNGGVQGMKVVEFENGDRIAKAGGGPGEFGQLVRTQLGERWSPMVRSHEKNGGDSYVYVQSSDESKLTRMIVVDLEGSELDMVSLRLNPDQLAKWMKEHDRTSKTSAEKGD
jgi:hypothetical protein